MKLKNDTFKDIEESPSVSVLKQALQNNRLAHAILLHGDNLKALEAVCFTLGHLLLECDITKVAKHPDFFTLRPTNKMRQINAERTRELTRKIQHSPNQGARKVAAIYEADRMNTTAANAFLKTLEEPPGNTTIFLLTTRPYSLLATIRSRCLNFRLPMNMEGIEDPDWQEWREMYAQWVTDAQTKPGSKQDVEKRVMGIYKLVHEFEQILKRLGDSRWKEAKTELPEGLSDEEELAQQSGIQKGIRHRLFKEIEESTRNTALKAPSPGLINKLAQVIKELERMAGLLEVNLNESTALESFLFSSLRTWAK